MKHVDVLRNDWRAGRQTWVGRVSLLPGGGPKVECADGQLAETLRQPVWRPDTGQYVEPVSTAFLEALTAKYQGSSVLVATAPHEDDVCAHGPARIHADMAHEPYVGQHRRMVDSRDECE